MEQLTNQLLLGGERQDKMKERPGGAGKDEKKVHGV